MQEKIIVLVEDNPNDEALTLRALRKNNVANKVVVARDGAQALDVLLGQGRPPQQDGGQVSLVLLDLKLPKVDGLEVLKKLREDPKTKLLPIVVLTSSKEEQDMIQSYSRGANSYIRKPVDFAQFIEAVRQLGLYWLVLNETPLQGV